MGQTEEVLEIIIRLFQRVQCFPVNTRSGCQDKVINESADITPRDMSLDFPSLELQIPFQDSGSFYSEELPMNNRFPKIYIHELVSISSLAEGTSSELYTALYRGSKVVVKIPRVGDRAIDKEISVLEKLDHPNIVKLIGGGWIETKKAKFDQFFVMEFMDESLSARISSDFNRLKPNQINSNRAQYISKIMKYALMLATGIDYLHEHFSPDNTVIHRDLKPDNIMFLDGKLKIIDFGLAKVIPKNEMSHEPYHMTGEVGTPRYMAPEVRALSYDKQVDIYSFGLVLWMMLMNEKPFASLSARQFRRNVVLENQRPPLSEWWPKSLCTLIESCWSSEPARRPNSSAIVQYLEQLLLEVGEEKVSTVVSSQAHCKL